MSISDRIVVMKEGAMHQFDRPQAVYDDPVDLFVAKFLGTPPINVFEGAVRGGRLFIGGEDVLDVEGVADRAVWIGIRPEGFLLKQDGRLTCRLDRVEVMGRDISVVSHHDSAGDVQLRSIIASENTVDPESPVVRFDLKPRKVFLFDRQTEARIPFSVPGAASEVK